MIGKLFPMRIMHIKEFSCTTWELHVLQKEYHLNSTDYEKQIRKAIHTSKTVMSLK